ncbi:MAG: hypothetical protein WC322_03320 [Candidatus Paceibacterota bacterium]|jgi:hypothetical protein
MTDHGPIIAAIEAQGVKLPVTRRAYDCNANIFFNGSCHRFSEPCPWLDAGEDFDANPLIIDELLMALKNVLLPEYYDWKCLRCGSHLTMNDEHCPCEFAEASND